MYIGSMDTKITYVTLGAALEANVGLLKEGVAIAFDKWSESASDVAIYNTFFSCKLTHKGVFADEIATGLLKAA
jgi:hypothetical protein